MTTFDYALIDTSALMRRYHSVKLPLSITWEGETLPVAALFGALKFLVKMVKSNTTPIFCLDAPGNLRKQADPTYKAGRVGPGAAYYTQSEIFQQVLKAAGVAYLQAEGYEADDFIVNAAHKLPGRKQVWSTDGDLLSTVNDSVEYFNFDNKRKTAHVTRANYAQILQIPYNTILLQKAMVGDTSDRVPGIPRFGPAAFHNFLYQLEGLYDFADIRARGLEREILERHLEGEAQAAALASLDMVLAFDTPIKLPPVSYNRDTLLWWLEQLQMRSLHAELYTLV